MRGQVFYISSIDAVHVSANRLPVSPWPSGDGVETFPPPPPPSGRRFVIAVLCRTHHARLRGIPAAVSSAILRGNPFCVRARKDAAAAAEWTRTVGENPTLCVLRPQCHCGIAGTVVVVDGLEQSWFLFFLSFFFGFLRRVNVRRFSLPKKLSQISSKTKTNHLNPRKLSITHEN